MPYNTYVVVISCLILRINKYFKSLDFVCLFFNLHMTLIINSNAGCNTGLGMDGDGCIICTWNAHSAHVVLSKHKSTMID